MEFHCSFVLQKYQINKTNSSIYTVSNSNIEISLQIQIIKRQRHRGVKKIEVTFIQSHCSCWGLWKVNAIIPEPWLGPRAPY